MFLLHSEPKPVVMPGLGDLLVQVVAAALDARFGFRGQFQLQVLGQDAFDEFEGQVA